MESQPLQGMCGKYYPSKDLIRSNMLASIIQAKVSGEIIRLKYLLSLIQLLSSQSSLE